ncbi:Indoleamine 2,3-dioxygenase [Amanita rubescens]|nr:Indoleamine 2,3-dioxygenase [Amanita rubescens]
MAPHPPPARLPIEWEMWEVTLEDAVKSKVRLGNKIGLTREETACSETWRTSVRMLPVLPVSNLRRSKSLLRRAHVNATIIPRPISIPLLRISAILKIPPLLTYADTVLYNWRVESETSVPSPTLASINHHQPNFNHIRSQITFSTTPDEEEFYLSIMRVILDEIFIGDDIAVRRITRYLSTLAQIIEDMKTLLEGLKSRCDPDTYYNDVRPWFNGQDADARGRAWVFEGIEEAQSDADAEGITIAEPTELSGPSAGQSSIIHVLDIFLGVDHESAVTNDGKPSFITRMKTYMPYQHRLFIDYLASYPRSLRTFVMARRGHGKEAEELTSAYNRAVKALKVFRDAHMIIAALYILGPARRAADRVAAMGMGEGKAEKVKDGEKERKPVIGTGGTALVTFLKATRSRTMSTIIPES